MPWWLFGLVALGILSVTIEEGQAFLSGRAVLSATQASSPPAATKVAAFDADRDVTPLDEVRLTGIWLSDLGIGTIVKKRIDDAYVIVKDADAPAYAVLYFSSTEGAAVEKGLRALIDVKGLVTVAGFRETGRTAADAVTADLIARGLAAGPPVVVLEPYFGDRAAALNDHVQTRMFTFAVFAGINLLFLAIAVIKARAWRARVAARRPTAAIPRVSANTARAAVQARTTTPVQSTPATPSPRDPFAGGPIQSPKGWFR